MTLFYHDGKTIPEAPNKDPDSVIDYGVDHSGWLGADTIVSSSWLVDDTLITANGQSVNGLTVDSSAFDTTGTQVWLSNGTELTTYTLTNRVTTSGGRTDDRSFSITVKQK